MSVLGTLTTGDKFKVEVKPYAPLLFFAVLCLLFYVHHQLLGIGQVRIADIGSPGAGSEEFFARVRWGLSLVAFYTSAVASIAVSAMIYLRSPKPLLLPGPRSELGSLLLIFLGLSAYAYFADMPSTGSGVNSALYALAEDAKLLSGKDGCPVVDGSHACGIAAEDVTDTVMLTVGFIILMLGVSLAAILKNSGQANIEDLASKYGMYRAQFYTTATVLVLGLVEVFFLLEWLESVAAVSGTVATPPSAGSGHEPIMSQASMARYVFLVSMGAAVLYSGVFLVMFSPVSYFLRARYLSLMADLNFKDAQERTLWENKYGFSERPADKIRDVFVMISPFIAGLVANYVESNI